MTAKLDKERIVYYRSEGGEYVRHAVNIRGAVFQGRTLEELKTNGKDACLCMLKHMLEVIDQEQPFELTEQQDLDVYFHGEQGSSLRKELQRYKDIFGELPDGHH